MDSDDISEDIADDSTEATRKKLEKFKFSGVDIKKLGGSSTTKKEKISESPEKFEIKTAEFPSEKWDEITRFNQRIKDLDSKEKIEEIQKEIKKDFGNDALWIQYGDELRSAKRYEESLQAYNTALIKDSKNRLALFGKGFVLQKLERWSDSKESFEIVLQNDPKNIDALLEVGYCWIQLTDSNKYDKAIDYYKKALNEDERLQNALDNLGYCYFSKGEYTTAIDYLKRSCRIEGADDSFAKTHIAICYFRSDENDEAEKVCDELIRKKIDNNYVYYMKGYILNESEKYSEAIVHLKTGLRFGKTLGLYHSLGFAYLELKKYNLAKMYYEHALEIKNTDNAFSNLGDCYYEQGNYEEAIENYNNALKISPDSKYALKGKLKSLRKLGDSETLVSSFYEFEKVNGEISTSRILVLLYKTLFDLKRWNECLGIIEKTIIADAGNQTRIVDHMLWKASTLHYQNKNDEALQIYDKILNEDSGKWDAYRLKADLLERKNGNLEVALENYDKCAEILKNQEKKLETECEVLVDKARVLKKIALKGSSNDEEKLKEAIKILDIVIDKDEKWVNAWIERGNCFWNLKNYIKSEESFQIALELNPNDEQTMADIGDCLVKIGSFREANMFYQKALQIDNSFIPAIFGTEECDFAFGKYEDALKKCEKILVIDSENDRANFEKARVTGAVKNYDKSIELWKKYIEKFSDSDEIPKAYTNMSLDYILNKQYTEAIVAAEESLRIDSKWYIAYWRIGDAYEELKEYEKAIEILEEHFIDFGDYTKKSSLKILIRCYKKLGNKEKKEECEKRLKELEEEK